MATNMMGQVYETLLCNPGMNGAVKVDVRINRKRVLSLKNVIERGLSVKTVRSQTSKSSTGKCHPFGGHVDTKAVER